VRFGTPALTSASSPFAVIFVIANYPLPSKLGHHLGHHFN
jgi:hypothetical protein